MKKLLWILIVLIVIAIIWLALDVKNAVFRTPAGFTPKAIVIPSGASVSRIAQILKSEGLISRPDYFRWYYKLFFRHKTLKSGEYLFERPMTMREIIFKLSEGKVVLEKLTIPEGLTIREIARMLDEVKMFPAAEFAAAAGNLSLIHDIDPSASDLEGYLFPDTYMVHKGTSAGEMVRVMVENFKRHFTPALVWRCRDIPLTIRQAVILASIIEKETSSIDERFLISSVFHNRLHRNMPLDSDPTIIYALARANRYRGKLGWDDLKYDSPYNTRLHRGLPPGPICNPGFAAIQGSLYPAETNFLYFVSKDGRLHQFSETLQDHNRAVRRYIIQHNAGPFR